MWKVLMELPGSVTCLLLLLMGRLATQTTRGWENVDFLGGHLSKKRKWVFSAASSC